MTRKPLGSVYSSNWIFGTVPAAPACTLAWGLAPVCAITGRMGMSSKSAANCRARACVLNFLMGCVVTPLVNSGSVGDTSTLSRRIKFLRKIALHRLSGSDPHFEFETSYFEGPVSHAHVR